LAFSQAPALPLLSDNFSAVGLQPFDYEHLVMDAVTSVDGSGIAGGSQRGRWN
jgi:hypothetical protein